MILFPRLHLFEIGDQPWCPDWLLAYIQSYLTSVWNFHLPPFTTSSPATTAAALITDTLPNPSSFTYVDLCAGAGGPTATMETVLNARFRARGQPPASFVLTDLHPRPEPWARIAKRQAHVSFVDGPVDATRCGRVARGRECRVFNLCFHHFDDVVARRVLRSAVQEGDAFIIFEFAQRNFSSLLNIPVMLLYPFFHTLGHRDYRFSPLHYLFTYLFPLFSVVCSFDGLVSTLRCRTPEELRDLLRQPDLDVSGWEFMAGNRMLAWPFLHIYWYMGVKK
ncbi:uncharacterized protein ACLA_013380 [Aspergillus clavatus NRRL 1]|uniref:Methyltransferase domain-containing protein n=1 Tax=Aspergillus clavatus (strain ATCC 1007 / CBS 513.65 / DSM 816 / NCTC 3887 / NRRL 1 / QM 1276 / 107) TaxID=344612 RepID=A1CAY5_ASPCL|nr:uncharacterized protein ACLA_013380 [Aspergillus clavatus NRRL 1]EAW12903.1 conserved hypothetical protein [Aspergillus clavatus NRRL 1]